MSQPLLCPVCETENAPDARNCEVCGERLAPLAAGERLAPEENVLAMINDMPPAAAPTSTSSEFGAVEPVFHTSGEEDALEDQTIQGMPSLQPDVLYSPLTGEAYPQGSAHHDEGFGPMGEELVATRPASIPSAGTPAQPGQMPELDLEEGEGASAAPGRDEAVSLEHKTSPEVEVMPHPQPLPTPGPLHEPATLTLYVQKQPVKTYQITTDETLIGRKDIRADIDPEIDLTAWDTANLVSRKHAYLYRQNKNYILYAISQGGIQVNSDLLELGDRRTLQEGDVVIVAGFLAMKFKLPRARPGVTMTHEQSAFPFLLGQGRYQVESVFAGRRRGMGILYLATDLRCAHNKVLIKTTRYDGGEHARHFRYTPDEARRHVEGARKILAWEKKMLVRFRDEGLGNIPLATDYFLDASSTLMPTYQGKHGRFELAADLLHEEPYLVMECIDGQLLEDKIKDPMWPHRT